MSRSAQTERLIFFLPLSLPGPLPECGVDPEVLARRLPDFLHHLLNRGGVGPTGMLEIQTPPGDEPPRWLTLTDVPEPSEVFSMLSDTEPARAIVTGQVIGVDGAVHVELGIHFADGGAVGGQRTVRGRIGPRDPVGDVCALARDVARALDISYPAGMPGLVTDRPAAFYRYLEGLDTAALLHGDPQLAPPVLDAAFFDPLVEAVALDPRFGLALRTAAMSFASLLHAEPGVSASCLEAMDRCLASGPTDGEGCVAIAEQCALLGENGRAESWLVHATSLAKPPSRAFESLGVIRANAGELETASALWQRGLELDGGPDFFAHLGRLAFQQQRESDAWDCFGRGLRRVCERLIRRAEWEGDADGESVLLRYLADHLRDTVAPPEIVAALHALVARFEDPEARIDLGVCLALVGSADLARLELEAGLDEVEDVSLRDQAVRALIGLDVTDFERRFARVAEQAARGRDPRSALTELRAFADAQDEFWPAMFFAAIALRRLGRFEEALDLIADILDFRPDQPDALAEMARLFELRGNAKRALELIGRAIGQRPSAAEFHAQQACYLERLGRLDEARESLAKAVALDPSNPEYREPR